MSVIFKFQHRLLWTLFWSIFSIADDECLIVVEYYDCRPNLTSNLSIPSCIFVSLIKIFLALIPSSIIYRSQPPNCPTPKINIVYCRLGFNCELQVFYVSQLHKSSIIPKLQHFYTGPVHSLAIGAVFTLCPVAVDPRELIG